MNKTILTVLITAVVTFCLTNKTPVQADYSVAQEMQKFREDFNEYISVQKEILKAEQQQATELRYIREFYYKNRAPL